ncbi:MAG: 6-carboxytetrahydropterin synthase [Thermoanaerobaculia bacterium]
MSPTGRLVLERSFHFSASHRYWRPEWTEAENIRAFGRCANSPAHGHNYRLIVRVSGEVDPFTGFIVDLPALDRWVEEAVIDRLDHAHINEALAEFAPGGKIPSSENLVLWAVEAIGRMLPQSARLEEVRLAEDDRLGAVWTRRET